MTDETTTIGTEEATPVETPVTETPAETPATPEEVTPEGTDAA